MTNPGQHSPAGELPPGLSLSGQQAFDKSGLLRETVRAFGIRTLIETGLYYGHGSGMEIAVERYIAVDWQFENVDAARGAGFEAHQGDSPNVLRGLLRAALAVPILFWLDAHALDEDEGSPTVCPVLAELDAIGQSGYARYSHVLIDDLWGMGTVRGWPTLDELRERADSFRVWTRDEHDGIMQLAPK